MRILLNFSLCYISSGPSGQVVLLLLCMLVVFVVWSSSNSCRFLPVWLLSHPSVLHLCLIVSPSLVHKFPFPSVPDWFHPRVSVPGIFLCFLLCFRYWLYPSYLYTSVWFYCPPVYRTSFAFKQHWMFPVPVCFVGPTGLSLMVRHFFRYYDTCHTQKAVVVIAGD